MSLHLDEVLAHLIPRVPDPHEPHWEDKLHPLHELYVLGKVLNEALDDPARSHPELRRDDEGIER